MNKTFIETYLSAKHISDSAPALKWATGQWTHQELKSKIKRRITWLKDNEFSPGDRLALCLPKGPAAIEFLFAGFATGIIPVPIDPLSPTGRLHMILSETSPRLLICSADIKEKYRTDYPNGKTPIITQNPFTSRNDANLALEQIEIKTEAPALILMTSGSTGTPKGITLSHQNIAVFVNAAIESFEFTDKDSFISIAPLHFDLSMLDIYASLQKGASVYLLSETEMSFPGNVAKVIEEHSTTIIYTVPSMLQILLRFRVFESIDITALRWVLFAGEVFPIHALIELMSKLPKTKFANLYGPTETNVIACHKVENLQDGATNLPIGLSFSNADLKICDENGSELPIGQTGEICAAGPSIMLGYWHNDGLQSLSQYGEYFRTGDFGYFDKNAILHYAGRRDDMVKIRGLRFNLLDIENTALMSNQVSQAAAIIVESGTLKAAITLYVVVAETAEFDKESLLSEMTKIIPSAAIPRNFVVIDALPQNSNGKIDRQKLLHMANSS